MELINFMVIGAVKAGTTSVYNYLKQHPQVYMSPIKETKFFQWDGETRRFSHPHDQIIYEKSIKTFGDYRALFESAKDEIAVGEATPSYLYNKEVPLRIYKRFPKVKLIVILRQPAERAFSHYLHTKWLGHEPLSFSDALIQERERIQSNWGPSWHYKQQGFYAEQIKRFQALFGESQVRTYLFDDLKANPLDIIRDMYSYLGVDPDFQPDVKTKHNERFFAKNPLIHELTNQQNPAKLLAKRIIPAGVRKKLWQAITAKNSFKPQLDPKLRWELTQSYTPDILKLQDLIHKDLSQWLQ
ncbi:sulfotransferase family protein [Coleofasciculus sp. E2-BRE-01]|uniref:sulfotransferase family protein n=1 Tax=Coleofasciculus sp. E2-BRE-01 TaxID=3069524 RepID=UPI0032F44B91